jgi:hypothetical protein
MTKRVGHPGQGILLSEKLTRLIGVLWYSTAALGVVDSLGGIVAIN